VTFEVTEPVETSVRNDSENALGFLHDLAYGLVHVIPFLGSATCSVRLAL